MPQALQHYVTYNCFGKFAERILFITIKPVGSISTSLSLVNNFTLLFLKGFKNNLKLVVYVCITW